MNNKVVPKTQLSKIFYMARLYTEGFSSGGHEDSDISFLEFIREVKTDSLPPMSTFDANELSALALQEIQPLSRFPEDRAAQLVQFGERPDDYYFYPLTYSS